MIGTVDLKVREYTIISLSIALRFCLARRQVDRLLKDPEEILTPAHVICA